MANQRPCQSPVVFGSRLPKMSRYSYARKRTKRGNRGSCSSSFFSSLTFVSRFRFDLGDLVFFNRHNRHCFQIFRKLQCIAPDWIRLPWPSLALLISGLLAVFLLAVVLTEKWYVTLPASQHTQFQELALVDYPVDFDNSNNSNGRSPIPSSFRGASRTYLFVHGAAKVIPQKISPLYSTTPHMRDDPNAERIRRNRKLKLKWQTHISIIIVLRRLKLRV
jgi:hypothetical protein